METVYDPNANQTYAPNQGTYTPDGTYVPPQQQSVPPQQQAPPPPQWQQAPPPQQPPDAHQQWQQGQQPPPPQGQQQWQPPQDQSQWQQAPPPQQQQRAQLIKLAPTRGQMQRTNLCMIEGWLNGCKVTTLGDGNIRLGFFIIWEMVQYENGQPKLGPNGQVEVRDFRYMCQAWGQVAQQLSQLPEGTAIKIYGTLNRWNASRDTNNPNWITDIKVNRFDPL